MSTHIRIRESTKTRLNKLRRPGQSFDGVIQEIIEELRRKKK